MVDKDTQRLSSEQCHQKGWAQFAICQLGLTEALVLPPKTYERWATPISTEPYLSAKINVNIDLTDSERLSSYLIFVVQVQYKIDKFFCIFMFPFFTPCV